jgi:menaquinone-9 beta-reductase
MGKDYDVIIVGAGPGGSSMATFLGRQGVPALLLDKAAFPRDKVCGDGLAPQALYWLDRLGCIDAVLDRSRACISTADVIINGREVVTGTFPQNTEYPGFSTLLERRILDDILVRHAVAHGAVFRPSCHVEKIRWEDDGVVAEAVADGKKAAFKAKLLIGADGASSIISQSIGNELREGPTAISVRAYYKGVRVEGSQVKVFFDTRFFPGYGWLFVDDDGKANIGIGLAADRNFPLRRNLRAIFEDFRKTDLEEPLKRATPIGRPDGWWASFSRPTSLVADRVMLIGDAANLADPVNGGGIHMAIESAFVASRVALEALASRDFSRGALHAYVNSWDEGRELSRRTGEFLLTMAVNPHFREFYLFCMERLARLIKADPRFQEFCGGIFSGVTPADRCLSPFALLEALPSDLAIWWELFADSGDLTLSSVARPAVSTLRTLLASAGRVASSPQANLAWGAEGLGKAFGLMQSIVDQSIASLRSGMEQLRESPLGV